MTEEISHLVWLASAARKFANVADEFLPDNPGAITEYLDALIVGVNRLGDMPKIDRIDRVARAICNSVESDNFDELPEDSFAKAAYRQ